MIFRGAIYEVKALPGTHGHEQQGRRYAVVVQSDRFSTSTITVALTSTRAGQAIFRPEFDLNDTTSRILTDQIFCIAHTRLGAFMSALEPAELADLDRALMLKLGLV